MRNSAPRILLFGAVLTLAFVVSNTAHADKDTRGREALRRAQQVISDLQDSNDGLTRDKSELTLKLADVTAALDKTKKELADAQHRLAGVEHQASSAGNEAKELNDKLSVTEKTTQDLSASLQQTQQNLQQLQQKTDAERKTWEEKTADLTQQNQQCEEKNGALAKLANDLMQRYKNKGVWEAFRAEEPLTGLKAVEAQNLLQGYRDQIDANHLTAQPSATP